MTEANPETTVKYGGGTADGISLEPHKRRCSSIRCADCVGRVGDDDTVLVSGFGSVGYPKAGPSALAESDRDLSLTIVSGGSVGPEIDDEP